MVKTTHPASGARWTRLWALAALLALGPLACTSRNGELTRDGRSGPSAPAETVGQEALEGQAIVEIVNLPAFKQTVLAREGKTVVDFYATWCPPCRAYSPILEKLAASRPAGVGFAKVDVDKAADIAQAYGIEAMPTTIIFENGKEVRRVLGVQSEAQLKEMLSLDR